MEIFPAMLRAIESAERSITFETFVYWEGEMVQKFSDALAAKAREGVKVHVLMDGIGCDCVDGDALRRMLDAGSSSRLHPAVFDLLRAGHDHPERGVMLCDLSKDGEVFGAPRQTKGSATEFSGIGKKT